jgi:hypothetical protein
MFICSLKKYNKIRKVVSEMRVIRRPWFLKLCLLFLFVFLTGLPQSCWQAYKTVKVETPIRILSQKEIADSRVLLRGYMEEKITNAKKKISQGEGYTFADYFGDRKDYVREIKSLKLESYFSEGEGLGVSKLKQLVTQNLKNEKDHAVMVAAREDYEKTCDPRYPLRKKAENDFKASGWRGVLVWFFFLYLKIMLPALGYLLVLLFEKQKEKKEFLFPNPFRFLLMLVIYPVAIGNIFLKWWNYTKREYWTEAEYRRTKENLFTYLSESEVQKIKAFAKSALSLRSWKEQLIASGLKPKHGLAAALIVTLLIGFIPNLTQAETKAKEISQHKVYLQQVVEQYAARISIENEQSGQRFDHDWQDKLPICCEAEDLIPVLTVWFFKIREKVFRFKKICRQIEHIPIYSVVWCGI